MQLEYWENPMSALDVWLWVKHVKVYCDNNNISIYSIPVV
jgi:hypothetical protein